MTCEVVVANRLGIALAADSAVTFTTNASAGVGRTTYATGANKIFQLAATEPVAAMVYSTADLNRIPWEVILKAYRRQLGNETFGNLESYRDDLMDFINTRTPQLLPAEVRERSTNAAAQDGVFYALNRVLSSRPVLQSNATLPADMQLAWGEAIQELEGVLAAAQVDASLDAADLT